MESSIKGTVASQKDGDGPEKDALRRSQREITMTEKGQKYMLDIKQKDRRHHVHTLSAFTSELKLQLTETSDTAFVRTQYTKWLSMYEFLLSSHDECQKFCASEESKLSDEREFQLVNSQFKSFKQFVEEWFLNHAPVIEPGDSVSRVSRSSSKLSSHLSVEKLKESQRKAELLARAAALKEKQKLEEARYQLKIKEEEFEIKTELQVSDARSRVLEELERSELRDRQLNEALANGAETFRKFDYLGIADEYNLSSTPVVQKQKPVASAIGYELDAYEDQAVASAGGLNPYAPIWQNVESHGAGTNTGVQQPSEPQAVQMVMDTKPKIQPRVEQSCSPDNNVAMTHSENQTGDQGLELIDKMPQTSVYQSSQQRASEGLLAVTRELNKPTAEILKFSGNPMDYSRFLRQFNARICANTDSYEERLNFLMQFTTGEAHKIVSGFSHLDAERGYNASLAEFKDRYGDPQVVAQAYVKRALEWPTVKQDDAKSLDDFAIFLKECQFAVENVQAARVLEYAENLKLLVRKLPYYLHDKWRNIVYETKVKGQVVKFSQLVQFVYREARKATDPVFGKDVMSVSSTLTKQPQGRRFEKSNMPRKNFAMDVEELPRRVEVQNIVRNTEPTKANAACNSKGQAFVKPCLFCEGVSHTLGDCRKVMVQPLKERYAFLRRKGLCFACLRSGHQRDHCRQKMTCVHCKKGHPSMLHVEPRPNLDGKLVSSELNATNPTLASASATHMGAGNTQRRQAVALLPVRIKHKNSDKYEETYAFLDSGSTATFCSERILRSLNIEGKKTKITLRTMEQETVQSTYVVTGLEVSTLSGENVVELPPVFSRSELPVSRKDVISPDDLWKWPHLKDVPLETINSDVGLLIGVNVPKVMEPWDVIPSVGNGPFAVKTLLGWVINGPFEPTHTDEESSMFVSAYRIEVLNRPCLEEQVRNHFEHDFSERAIDDVFEPSKEDRQFMDKVTESTTFKDGHYQISLPFKSKSVSMPNNRKQAEQRMAMLGKRLSKDQDFCKEYNCFMDKIIKAGYARKVPFEQLQQDDGRVWYLPHHGVYHPRKKKLRVVFDCAARYQGVSLNDVLLQVPVLTNTLVGTLLRFRSERIAVMGDIESMFYQVLVPNDEASFLRFLWWEDGDLGKHVLEYQMVVHIFGVTSSPSCAQFALRKTAMDNAGQFGAEAIKTVLKNFYVDDCLKSASSVDKAVALVKDVQSILSKGGFHIAKWISNSREVMNTIPVSERAKEVMDLDLDHDALPIERALGVRWCVESDAFCFKIVMKEHPLTRRGILSMVSSVFDPLGFLAPFMLMAKRLLQELCKSGLGWDEQVPEQFSEQWRLWLDDIQRLADFKVDRCLKPSEFSSVVLAELHHFADASEIGYGTVTFLRLKDADGRIHCAFIMGKSRVAPLKQTTIPRLELTAATVAVRTDKMLKNELDMSIHRTVFWTDSMAVLRYIRNTTSRFLTFVANRLVVIQEGSSAADWRYVSTKLNPADLASRGLCAENFLQVKRWIEAPKFLQSDENEWPDIPSEVSYDVDPADPEVKRAAIVASTRGTSITGDALEGVNKLISYHSSWFALKRSVAWILRIKAELLRRVRFKGLCGQSNKLGDNEHCQSLQNSKSSCIVPISVQDMDDAERAIIIFTQRQAFAEEMSTLMQGHPHVKNNSYIKRLDPIMVDDLLRVGGRLHETSMPMESKHPVILPKNNHVSNLVLKQVHHDLKHSGRNHMLAHLRQRYWLVNAPSAIRGLISKCVTCRRMSSLGEQKMANLPEDRVTPDETPFTRVGVDYFGPFEVKVKRLQVKRYGVIFTCLASRAVHLEIAYSLDTDSYINALRRFIARRGQVTKIRSDNGTNFVGADRELAKAISDWNVSQIHNAMLQQHVDWQFNPPAGSHHGGVWERMIRSVRRVMNSVLKEQKLDDEGLHTLLCEIESTINSRPITRVSDHPGDLEALTPNHLLLMNRKPSLPPGVFSKTDTYCRRRWRQVQYMANLFWQRWVREYLPLLQERQKWCDVKRNLSVGDVVLVADSNAPRNSWPLGVVLEVMPDRLGQVRQVKVKTQTSVLVRPIDKLCLILESD